MLAGKSYGGAQQSETTGTQLFPPLLSRPMDDHADEIFMIPLFATRSMNLGNAHPMGGAQHFQTVP